MVLEGGSTQAAPVTRGFLFADLRGYTAFTEAHGDKAARALLDSYRHLVRDVVGQFGGAEIKTEGDSFYVVFPSATAAVKCGIALVEAATKASHDQPDLPIHVGVGIHAGETADDDEGYVGFGSQRRGAPGRRRERRRGPCQRDRPRFDPYGRRSPLRLAR